MRLKATHAALALGGAGNHNGCGIHRRARFELHSFGPQQGTKGGNLIDQLAALKKINQLPNSYK